MNSNKEQTLPIAFVPDCYDVICAREKKAKNYSGNKFYQTLITNAIPQYSQAKTKIDKTLIVNQILDEIQTKSPHAEFIKTKLDGSYCRVTDSFAREKIEQNLRDKLSNKYKSSTKAKRRRRVAVSTQLVHDVDNIIQSNQFVSKRMNILTETIERNVVESTPEFYMNQLFIQTNKEILEAFKKDEGLLSKFNEAEVYHKLQQSRQ